MQNKLANKASALQLKGNILNNHDDTSTPNIVKDDVSPKSQMNNDAMKKLNQTSEDEKYTTE